MKLRLSALAFALLIGCSGAPDLDDPKLSTRNLNLEEFFQGKTVAHGQFQDLFGNVKRRFEVDINGTWDGQTLTLVEDFIYADGSTEQRIWTLNKTGDDTWSGTAPGVIGQATGEERGDTFNWTYRIDLPGRDGIEEVVVNEDDRVLNRAYVKKFGITVGEAIIVFEKR